MLGVAVLAAAVRANPAGVPRESPLRIAEQELVAQMTAAIRSVRQLRDVGFEFAFRHLYGDLPLVWQPTPDIARDREHASRPEAG
jgi:hypothetical protein